MAHHNKRPTVSSYEINIAVRLLLHGSSLLDAAGYSTTRDGGTTNEERQERPNRRRRRLGEVEPPVGE